MVGITTIKGSISSHEKSTPSKPTSSTTTIFKRAQSHVTPRVCGVWPYGDLAFSGAVSVVSSPSVFNLSHLTPHSTKLFLPLSYTIPLIFHLVQPNPGVERVTSDPFVRTAVPVFSSQKSSTIATFAFHHDRTNDGSTLLNTGIPDIDIN